MTNCLAVVNVCKCVCVLLSLSPFEPEGGIWDLIVSFKLLVIAKYFTFHKPRMNIKRRITQVKWTAI